MEDNLKHHLDSTLAVLCEFDRVLLQARLGYEGKTSSFTEISALFSIARSRSIYRYHQCVSQTLSQEHWCHEIELRINAAIMNIKEPVNLNELQTMDPWFKGFEDNYIHMANVIIAFSGDRFNIIEGRIHIKGQ